MSDQPDRPAAPETNETKAAPGREEEAKKKNRLTKGVAVGIGSAAIVLETDSENERGHVERLMIILRSASSPKAAEIVRDALRHDILEPFAELIQGRNPALRASFIMAVFMGITMVRTVMQVGPLCDADRDIVRVKVKQLFEAALSEAS